MSLNHVEKINPELYQMLRSLLNTGKIEKDGNTLDFSPVQNITVGNGFMQFDPPLKVSGKFGPFKINTTITEISAKATNSIFVDIDSSPVNVEIKPE